MSGSWNIRLTQSQLKLKLKLSGADMRIVTGTASMPVEPSLHEINNLKQKRYFILKTVSLTNSYESIFSH